MFGIGAQELLVIIVVALLIVGPKKLPEIARSLGKGVQEFKKTAEGISEDVRDSFVEKQSSTTKGMSDASDVTASSSLTKAAKHNEAPSEKPFPQE